MSVDDVMPWIVIPLVLIFLVRSIIKKAKGGGRHGDRRHDSLHDNLHDGHDFGGSDGGGGDSDD